ncbi:REP-associated tyrosine transposase [Arenimonas donghaensis]|nr:transposase [Arenimonas donghaensis]
MPFLLNTPGQASLRKGRRSLSGQAYFLTFTTHRRERVFRDWEPGAAMSRLVSEPSTWPKARLMAWVLMPDHWHGLLVLECSGELSKVVGQAKGATASSFNLMTGRTGALWSRGFHDRAIRNDECLRAVARYLVGNPLRAGLADRAGNYPFWDAAWLTDTSLL